MKVVVAVVLAGALAASAAHLRAGAGPQSATKPTQKTAATDRAKDAAIPPPISVEVVAVNAKAKTITVREITAVPAPPENRSK
jgi:hypothetical protein